MKNERVKMGAEMGHKGTKEKCKLTGTCEKEFIIKLMLPAILH